MSDANIQRPENTIGDLRDRYSSALKIRGRQLGLRETLVQRLREPHILLPSAAAITAIGMLVPGWIEGISKGLDPLEAIPYTLASTPLSAIWADVQGASATEDLLGNYMLAIRASIVPAIFSTSLIGGSLYLWNRAREYVQSLKEGSAPIERFSTQLFTLFGSDSYVGDLLYNSLGDHVIPVVEEVKTVRRVVTGKERRGFFLIIPDGEYAQGGATNRWENLKVNKDWLLKTTKGKKLLVTIGLGETRDEELPLVQEQTADLTVEEQAIAVEKIKELFLQTGIGVDRTVNIHLGHPNRKRKRGTGRGLQDVSDLEVAAGTIDIFPDAGKILVKALANKVNNQTIVFETGVLDYWKGLKESANGLFIVHDESNPDDGKSPILVYERLTDESVQSAKDLKKKYPDRRIIVLTSSFDSHEKAIKAGLESVCSSLELANTLVSIVQRLQAGEEPEEIQKDFL